MAEINAGKKQARFGGRFWGWIALILVGGIAFGFAVRAFIRARSTPSENACVNNLRQIDGAKHEWASETKASSNAVPTWEDIKPYLGRGTAGSLPKCPQGGLYTIGSLQVDPTCSIPGHTLN